MNTDEEAFLPHHFQLEVLINPNDPVVKSLKVYIPPLEFMLDPI